MLFVICIEQKQKQLVETTEHLGDQIREAGQFTAGIALQCI